MDTFPDLGALGDQELKDLIQQLTKEEQEVSYQRRILHGKIDILRAELVNRLRKKREEGEAVITGADVQQLTDILAGKGMPGDQTEEPQAARGPGPMHCPECGFVNAEGANYCQKCGAFLGGVAEANDSDDTTVACSSARPATSRPVDPERISARAPRSSSAPAAAARARRSSSRASRRASAAARRPRCSSTT